MVIENPLIIPGVSIDPQSRAAFMEWLSGHDARVRAEAVRQIRVDLEDWADSLTAPWGDPDDERTWVDRSIGSWLDERADQIEKGADRG